MKKELKIQISNMKVMLDTFETSCRLATLADDNITDPQEDKELKQIRKAVDRFRKELDKVK